MNESGPSSADTLDPHGAPEHGGVPPGDHPLEVAARAGFGPLSPAALEVWHGDAQPCVTCGQLVRRNAVVCDHCGQDLSPAMLDRMRAHAGPWYVLEHVRPFPGVNLDRIIRQVYRGLITETSIVRGPTTDYQWRFAVETPGLCRFFRKCWHCHGEVSLTDVLCRGCGASLSFDRPVSQAGPTGVRSAAPPQVRSSGVASGAAGPNAAADNRQLAMLREAARQTGVRRARPAGGDAMRIGGVRVAWIAAVIVIGVFAALVLITRMRHVAPAETVRTAVPPAVEAPERFSSPAPSLPTGDADVASDQAP